MGNRDFADGSDMVRFRNNDKYSTNGLFEPQNYPADCSSYWITLSYKNCGCYRSCDKRSFHPVQFLKNLRYYSAQAGCSTSWSCAQPCLDDSTEQIMSCQGASLARTLAALKFQKLCSVPWGLTRKHVIAQASRCYKDSAELHPQWSKDADSAWTQIFPKRRILCSNLQLRRL